MLCRVTQSVDRLQDKGLFLAQVFDLAVGHGPPHASVKTDRLLSAPLANPSTAMQDRSLQQHLEPVIELDQGAADPAPVVGPVEQFDAQDQRVAGLLEQELRFALHAPIISTNRSASFTRRSPEMSLGSSVSRTAPRLRDSCAHSTMRS